MNLKKELGKKIQQLRKQKKLTQEKLAEKVGIDSKSISKIENGNNYPTPETLTSIAQALNCDIYELFIFNKPLDFEKMKAEIIKGLENKQTILYLYKILKGI